MNNDSPIKALAVVLAVALVCSVLVSVSAVVLRPVQERNALVERSRTMFGWPRRLRAAFCLLAIVCAF